MKVADLNVEELEALIHKVFEEEMEDLYFTLDPNIRSKIEEGLKDIEEGKLTSLDDLITQRKASSGKV